MVQEEDPFVQYNAQEWISQAHLSALDEDRPEVRDEEGDEDFGDVLEVMSTPETS
jgi:hypothetical protein